MKKEHSICRFCGKPIDSEYRHDRIAGFCSIVCRNEYAEALGCMPDPLSPSLSLYYPADIAHLGMITPYDFIDEFPEPEPGIFYGKNDIPVTSVTIEGAELRRLHDFLCDFAAFIADRFNEAKRTQVMQSYRRAIDFYEGRS